MTNQYISKYNRGDDKFQRTDPFKNATWAEYDSSSQFDKVVGVLSLVAGFVILFLLLAGYVAKV